MDTIRNRLTNINKQMDFFQSLKKDNLITGHVTLSVIYRKEYKTLQFRLKGTRSLNYIFPSIHSEWHWRILIF